MGLQDDAFGIREQGIERAAAIWESLEALSPPVDPINIYKASCSVKCAEFLARVRSNIVFDSIMSVMGEFIDCTIKIANERGSSDEGMRVVEVIEAAMPLTDEIFDDASAYATRQHVFDGLILLSAAKMGKEQETKACLEHMQSGVGKAMLMALLVQVVAGAKSEGSPE